MAGALEDASSPFPNAGEMTMSVEYENLRERYVRLRAAAQRVVDDTRAVGDGERPQCGVEPHLIRQLRRELEGEPQPQPLAWMSASDAVP